MPLNYTKINQEIDDLWEQKNKAFNKLKVRIKLVEKFNELEENLNSNTNNKNNDNEILLKEKKKMNN